LKNGGLRRRWLVNTVGVVCALGLICALLVTAAFAVYSYSSISSDIHSRAQSTAQFFADYDNQDYDAFYQSCITYAQTFEERNTIELQFIDADGMIVASSYGQLAGENNSSADILDAIANQEISSFIGKDPQTQQRVIAVSSPVRYPAGEVMGVFRYVTTTQSMDRQILIFGGFVMVALFLIVMIVLITSNHFIHSILSPLSQIVEKAKMIAGGSYGIQIQTKYDDEIGELAQTINEMSIQINQNEKTQAEFISSLSHELRTPLTAITGWSETLLSSEDLDEGTRRGVSIILREGKRLTEMVLELLDFTRIQDGRMKLNMELTDVRADFEDTVFMYGSRLAQEGIKLEYLDDDVDIPEISCDPKRLRQVYLNILDNAAKHGGDGKKIEAGMSYDGSNVIVKIRDFGPGIPEDELSLVKKKFYKGSSKARGSGIGLAVCDEIVQMHGGELILENAPGGGTLVTVSIPASQ